MFLSLLSKEEKYLFVDLLNYFVKLDGQPSESEELAIKRLTNEMGEEVWKYKKSNTSLDKTIEKIKEKSGVTKNLVFLNIVAASLNDEFYCVEEHVLINRLAEEFGISNKKRQEIMRIVYAERDLREKAKRIISE